MDAGLFVARVVVGLLMAAHGSQKLFGWFGGYGLTGTGAFFEQLGFRPGRLFAAAAAVAEVTGGLLLVAGLLGPIGPALVVSVMVVAAATVHWQHGLFAQTNGIEVPLLYATAASALAFTGYGGFSLDYALGLGSIWTPGLTLAVLAAGLIGGLANLTLRQQSHSAATA
ncbi:MAG TPA: DoxX family protein [Vicinamibacterales bacterium]|jgi:putative oxidoreductase